MYILTSPRAENQFLANKKVYSDFLTDSLNFIDSRLQQIYTFAANTPAPTTSPLAHNNKATDRTTNRPKQSLPTMLSLLSKRGLDRPRVLRQLSTANLHPSLQALPFPWNDLNNTTPEVCVSQQFSPLAASSNLAAAKEVRLQNVRLASTEIGSYFVIFPTSFDIHDGFRPAFSIISSPNPPIFVSAISTTLFILADFEALIILVVLNCQ